MLQKCSPHTVQQEQIVNFQRLEQQKLQMEKWMMLVKIYNEK